MDVSKSAGAAGRERYRHAEEPGVSFDTQENLAAAPAHSATAAALHARLHAAWRSWAPRGHRGTRRGLGRGPEQKVDWIKEAHLRRTEYITCPTFSA